MKKKVFLTLGGLIIFLLIIFEFFIVQAVTDIKQINQEVYRQRQELEEKFLAGQNLRKTTEDLKKLEEKIPELNFIFVEENKELEFITALEKIAKNNSLTQKIELDNNAEIISANIKALPLRLYLSGSFNKFTNYLTDLQKLNYYINFDTLTVNNAQGTNKSQELSGETLEFFIGGKIFWRKLNI
ncbi:MAG: type 4a pilus biogenesis protein PilO [Candidatus Buchananbacteria bacterium]